LSPSKKTAAALLLVLLLGPASAPALTVQLGVHLGTQIVNDAKVKEAYGSGFIHLPYLQVSVWRNLFLGVAYEGGFEKNALLGVYADPAVLTMKGLNLTLGYEFRAKGLAAYLKAGYGLYAYRQTIPTSPFSAAHPVDERRSTAVASAGVKFYPEKFFFIAAEAKYVPMKVRPYDISVDLGGWRLLAGLGLSFGTKPG